MRIEKFVVMVLLLVSATQSSHSQTLAQALNATNLTWTTSGTSGASGWTVQNSTTHDGLLAAQSGTLSGFGPTSILQTITNGPATMTFWWYCPSFIRTLSVSINNIGTGSTSGNIANGGWQFQTVYLGSGSQTVKWVYSASGSGDLQSGYLDEVSFIPGETAPIITTQPVGQSQVMGMNARFSIGVLGTPPFGYQWQFNGINIPGAAASSFTVTNVQAANLGYYRVVVTNSAGSLTSSNAVLEFGEATAWGSTSADQTLIAPGTSNLLAVSAGHGFGLALRSDRRVLSWGSTNYGQQLIPTSLTNAIGISAGVGHALALRANGTVAAWGLDNTGQTDVPPYLANVVAIAAGDEHSLALKSDGTVVGWGHNSFGQTNPPTGLSNVVAIAADLDFSLALKSDGTVVAWGLNTSGQTNVPSGLSNVVSISTGGFRCLALKSDGTVVGWGNSSLYNLTTPPASWTNLAKISAGNTHNVGLRKNGTVVAWGSGGPATNVPTGLTNVVSIGAATAYSLAQVGGGPPVQNAPMSNPVLSSNGLSVTIPTQSGYVYRMEYKESLSVGDWIALPLVAGNGTNLVLTDPTSLGSQRFYRVRRW